MELIPVTCNHCGASLQVSDTARFVTCRYCNSQLEIKRTDSAISTEVLQRIDQNTAAMADDLHVLRRDSELERLDREWNQRREQLLVKNKDGSTATPTAAGGLIVAVVAGGFGIFWTVFTFALTASIPREMSFIHVIFPLFGVLFVFAAIAMGIKTMTAASKYEEEERQYQQRRRQLLSSPAPDPYSSAPTDPSGPR